MNNDKLIDLIKDQKDKLASAVKILEMSGDDQEVKKMAESIKPVLDVYSESEQFDIASVEKIKNLTGFVIE
jgi:nitrogen-specific signal transduction histidine kinase